MSARRGVVILKATFLAWMMTSALGCASLHVDEEAGSRIVKSRFSGWTWNQGQADASIVSQDGGFSYSVPGGFMWWFGDSFRGSRDRSGKPHFSGGAVSCAVGLRSGTDQRVLPVLRFLTGADGTVAQAIGFLPGESWDRHRIWPTSGIYVNGKAYTYYSVIELGKGGWDFKNVGAGLARSTEPLAPYERIQAAEGWRFPVAPQAVLPDGDWIYLYAVAKIGDQQGIWLSRVQPNQIEHPSAYEFYCAPGPTFSRDKSTQCLFLEDVYGQTSVAWNEYLQQYVMVTSSNLCNPRRIWFRTADKPWGPWGKPVADITIPRYRQGRKVKCVYCAYLHPELFSEKGRIMNVTCSVMLADAEVDANNEVIEVEIESLAR